MSELVFRAPVVYSCDYEGHIRMTLFPETYAVRGHLLGHRACVVGFGLSEDGLTAVSVALDGLVIVWDVKAKVEKVRRRIADHLSKEELEQASRKSGVSEQRAGPGDGPVAPTAHPELDAVSPLGVSLLPASVLVTVLGLSTVFELSTADLSLQRRHALSGEAVAMTAGATGGAYVASLGDVGVVFIDSTGCKPFSDSLGVTKGKAALEILRSGGSKRQKTA